MITSTQFAILEISVVLIPIFCGIMGWLSGRYYDRRTRAEFDRRERIIADDRAALAHDREALAQGWHELKQRQLNLAHQVKSVGEVAKLEAEYMNDQTELMIMDWEQGGLDHGQ